MSIYIAVHFLKDQIYAHPNISVIVSVSSLLLWLSIRRPSDIPPNPWFIFPLVGHRPLIRGDPLMIIRRLRKEFGEVFSVYVDAQLVIVVSGLSAIKEAFDTRGSEFHWRPNTRTCDLFHFGVICNSGKEWREQRGVTDAGIQKVNPNISVFAKREALHFAAAIKDQKEPIDTSVLVPSAVFNALSSVIFSRRLDYKDVRVEKVVERFTENVQLFSDTKFPNFFPFQKFLMGDFFDVKYLRINMTEIHQKIINPVFEEHKAEFNEEKVVDFVDVYLREMKANKGKEETTVEERSCQAVIYDILWHATCVTSATLQWAFVFLIRHPEIATNLQRELDEVFNTSENKKEEGSEGHKKPTDFPVSFHAFIKEVQRCANVCPMSMAHAVAKEKFLKGYRIPGDAVILPNLDSLMMDADIWGDPLNFRPERFINPDGRLSVPTEFIPFFLGIRNCPGSHIALAILNHFLASVLYNFNLLPASEGLMPSTQRKRGLIPLPPDFKVTFVPRRERQSETANVQ